MSRLFPGLLAFIMSLFFCYCNRSLEQEIPGLVEYELPEKRSINENSRQFNSVLFEDGLYHDVPKDVGVQNVIERVDQFIRLEWTPLEDVPKYPKGFITKGNTLYGVPYSFSSITNGVVGIDVSLYTFSSAVNNPYSNFYTIDIREAPYNTILAGSYYGSVCSYAVAFFLGMKVPYVTYLLDTCPWIVKNPEQTPGSICVGDILWQKNHVMLVYDIARDKDGSIIEVTIAEGIEPVARKKKYSFKSFQRLWEEKNMVDYCYTEICGTEPIPQEHMAEAFWGKTPFVSTSRGDMVSFWEGERVVLNTLYDQECEIFLYKEDELYNVYEANQYEVCINDLKSGKYSAFLDSDPYHLHGVFFEVIDTNVRTTFSKGSLTIRFSSNEAKASSIVICNSNYHILSIYPLTEEDVSRGYIKVPLSNSKDCNALVFFNGAYGRISSRIQAIK